MIATLGVDHGVGRDDLAAGEDEIGGDAHSAAHPPSTGMSAPVIWRDTSLAKNRHALATSLSVVTRCSAYSAAWRCGCFLDRDVELLRHVGADLVAEARTVDHAGRDVIDVDVVLPDFEREALGDAAQAPFRGRIGHAAGAPAHAERAADIDDLAVALRHHGGQHRVHGVETAAHVEGDDLVELVRRRLRAGLADRPGAARDVDQNVDAAAELVLRGLRGARRRRSRWSRRTEPRSPRRRSARISFATGSIADGVAPDQRQPAAFLRERLAHRGAHSLRRSGDHRDAAFQSQVHVPELLPGSIRC